MRATARSIGRTSHSTLTARPLRDGLEFSIRAAGLMLASQYCKPIAFSEDSRTLGGRQSLYGQFQGSNDLVNQRLVGEVHLDGFDVSHTKDNILWRGSQEDDVQEGLKTHCASYRDFAKDRRLDDDDQRAPSEADTKMALDDIKKELTSPEMVDQINVNVIPTPEVIQASKKRILKSVVEARGPQPIKE